MSLIRTVGARPHRVDKLLRVMWRATYWTQTHHGWADTYKQLKLPVTKMQPYLHGYTNNTKTKRCGALFKMGCTSTPPGCNQTPCLKEILTNILWWHTYTLFFNNTPINTHHCVVMHTVLLTTPTHWKSNNNKNTEIITMHSVDILLHIPTRKHHVYKKPSYSLCKKKCSAEVLRLQPVRPCNQCYASKQVATKHYFKPVKYWTNKESP